jgi:NAD(P)-dependent dehydrogenase (short-subunit alcohol dehydrogenase family)
VTSQDSIAALVEAAGQIDVLVNNAGIGGVGAFEAMPMRLIRQLIETNTIGVMAMCQAFIPQMRVRRAGCIVNVTSSVTLGAFPLAAAYTATKQAIEGFTASLAHELGYFGIRAKLVEPGYTHHAFRGQCHCARKRLAAWRLRRFCPPHPRGFCRPGADNPRERCRASGVVRSTRSHRPTSLSGRGRCAGAGRCKVTQSLAAALRAHPTRRLSLVPVIRVQGCAA